jgi:hypothetical protein
LPAGTASLLLLLRGSRICVSICCFFTGKYLYFSTSKAREIGGPGGGAAEAEAASCHASIWTFVLVKQGSKAGEDLLLMLVRRTVVTPVFEILATVF